MFNTFVPEHHHFLNHAGESKNSSHHFLQSEATASGHHDFLQAEPKKKKQSVHIRFVSSDEESSSDEDDGETKSHGGYSPQGLDIVKSGHTLKKNEKGTPENEFVAQLYNPVHHFLQAEPKKKNDEQQNRCLTSKLAKTEKKKKKNPRNIRLIRKSSRRTTIQTGTAHFVKNGWKSTSIVLCVCCRCR